MKKLAVTIQVQCMVPADDYDGRMDDIIEGLETGLQRAHADYAPIEIRKGISTDAGDQIT